MNCLTDVKPHRSRTDWTLQTLVPLVKEWCGDSVLEINLLEEVEEMDWREKT